MFYIFILMQHIFLNILALQWLVQLRTKKYKIAALYSLSKDMLAMLIKPSGILSYLSECFSQIRYSLKGAGPVLKTQISRSKSIPF